MSGNLEVKLPLPAKSGEPTAPPRPAHGEGPTWGEGAQRVLPAALRLLQHPLRHLEEGLEEAVEAVVGMLEEGMQLPGKPPAAGEEADVLDGGAESLAEGAEGGSEEGVHAAVDLGAVLEDVIHPVLQQTETFLQVLQLPLLPLVPLQQRVDALPVHPDGEGGGMVEEFLQLPGREVGLG